MSKLTGVLLLILSRTVTADVCSNNSQVECKCKQTANPWTRLPLSKADCSSLNLQNVPDNLENHLNYLDLSMNNIEALDPRQHELASKNLYTLELRFNRINTIHPDFFKGLPNLQELYLRNNHISAIESSRVFQSLEKLQWLDLSFNNIVSIPDGLFLPLKNLIYLDLSYNNLGGSLVKSQDTMTRSLGVSANLTHLFLAGLNISKFPNSYFDEFKQMVWLSLADNALTVVPMVPYTTLKLDLSGNHLTFLSAKYLNYHSLRSLELNRMPSLTDIHHYAFYNLYALEELIIEDCPNLREFSELAFDVASKNTEHHLKVLSLARNGLQRLNNSYRYYFKKMKRVDLSHNSWECDCDILWLQDFESVLYKPEDMTCSSPGNLRHKQIMKLAHYDLQECFPNIYGKRSHRILIVGLTCAIIVLCGLIFYLLRYPINTRGGRWLGPLSPYSAAPERV